MNDTDKIKAIMIVFTHWETDVLRYYRIMKLMLCIMDTIGEKQLESTIYSLKTYFKSDIWFHTINMSEYYRNHFYYNKQHKLLVKIADNLLQSLGGVIKPAPCKTLRFIITNRMGWSLEYMNYLGLSESQLRAIDALTLCL